MLFFCANITYSSRKTRHLYCYGICRNYDAEIMRKKSCVGEIKDVSKLMLLKLHECIRIKKSQRDARPNDPVQYDPVQELSKGALAMSDRIDSFLILNIFFEVSSIFLCRYKPDLAQAFVITVPRSG